MVSFTDDIIHDQRILTIAEGHSTSEGASHLPVYDPVIGCPSSCQPNDADLVHPSQWFIDSMTGLHDPASSITTAYSKTLLLRSSLHSKDDVAEHFTLLGDHISDGKTTWTAPLASFGHFSFIERYWEWLGDVLRRFSAKLTSTRIYGAIYASSFIYNRDDNLIQAFCELWCPATNTLHTTQGEMSISHWNLHYIGGLPVYGRFYDEVIPPARDLIGHGKDNKSLLPSGCKYLFSAYHRLVFASESRQVTAQDWVNFWFRPESKCSDPPPYDQRERVDKPTGHSSEPPRCTKSEEGAFDDLGIRAGVREEAYLAAFLACWLSVFVQPNYERELLYL